MMSYFLSIVSMTVLFFLNRSHQAATSQEKKMADNPLTSHVLDTGKGGPATGVPITLYKLQEATGSWDKITSRATDGDGRVSRLLTDSEFTVGTYKFHFDTKAYYSKMGTKTFYPFIEIVFEIERPSEHYHVPILLSPYGYTTYRGS